MKYLVSWEETHKVKVEAKSREEAVEKANSGEYDYDNSEMSSGFEVLEISNE